MQAKIVLGYSGSLNFPVLNRCGWPKCQLSLWALGRYRRIHKKKEREKNQPEKRKRKEIIKTNSVSRCTWSLFYSNKVTLPPLLPHSLLLQLHPWHDHHLLVTFAWLYLSCFPNLLLKNVLHTLQWPKTTSKSLCGIYKWTTLAKYISTALFGRKLSIWSFSALVKSNCDMASRKLVTCAGVCEPIGVCFKYSVN